MVNIGGHDFTGLGSQTRARRRSAAVRLYDFRRPDKFSKEQTRTLELIHENVARLLTTILSAYLRTMVEVVLQDIRQMTFGEYLAPLSGPVIIGLVNMPPLEGNAVLVIDAQVAFPILDRLFGGPGHALDEPRALTELEQDVLQRILAASLHGLGDAWEQVTPVKPHLVSMESNPLFIQVVAPNEMVIAIRFSIKIGEHQGYLQLCLPYLLLEPILPRLSAHHWFARTQTRTRGEGVTHQIKGVDVEVWVELGSTQLTLRSLLGLEVGDVVKLSPQDTTLVTVYVEDQPCFRGRAGRVGNQLAVSIVEKIGREGVARNG